MAHWPLSTKNRSGMAFDTFPSFLIFIFTTTLEIEMDSSRITKKFISQFKAISQRFPASFSRSVPKFKVELKWQRKSQAKTPFWQERWRTQECYNIQKGLIDNMKVSTKLQTPLSQEKDVFYTSQQSTRSIQSSLKSYHISIYSHFYFHSPERRPFLP